MKRSKTISVESRIVNRDISTPEDRYSAEAEMNRLFERGFQLSRACFFGDKGQYLSALLTLNVKVEEAEQ